jgi:hypothetical protein
MFTFEEDNYYKTFYYYKPAYYEKIRLIGFEKEKINKKSMFYYIFNNRYDCVTEFIPDTLLIRNIYPNRYHNSFHYFALYRHRDVDCEFNFPKLKLKENIILHNKKYVDYLLGKLVSGAIMPSLPVPSRL